MRKFLLLISAGLILGSCDNLKKKDTKGDDEEEVTTKKKKKPLEEVEEDEETPVKKKKPVEEDVVEDEDADDNPTVNYKTGWSNLEKETFMTNCTKGAKQSMGESGADDYCSCMLQKIEKLYPRAEESANLSMAKTQQLAKGCLPQ